MNGLTYWWKKYQFIKEILREYMKKNKINSVEAAIENLLNGEC